MVKSTGAAVLTAAVLALSACGSGGGSASPSPGGTEPRVLKLWHYETADSAMGKAWAEAIKKFEASHPNVTVAFEEKGFEQIQKTAAMVLNSDEAPDIMEYNKGNATSGLLSKQGLLADLSEEATKRGWDKLLPGGLQTTAKYDDRGVMGSGKWYGVPNYGEFVMVYYNKDLFDKHQVKVPASYEEFTAALDTFVKAACDPHLQRRLPNTRRSRSSTSSRSPRRRSRGWTPSSPTRARSTSTAPSSPTAPTRSPTG